MDDSDQLKPCPFCGSKAEIITLEGEDGDVGIGAQCVQCTSSACGAASGLIYPLMDDVTDLLRERWNNRPMEAPRNGKKVNVGLSDSNDGLADIMGKPTQHPKCKGTTDYWGESDCGYKTALTCDECKYGSGRKNPEAKCNGV
jgi:hypothetical protein